MLVSVLIYPVPFFKYSCMVLQMFPILINGMVIVSDFGTSRHIQELEIYQAMLWLLLFSCISIFLPNCSKYGCNFFYKEQTTKCTSDSDCKLLIAPINLEPTPVTAALLEVFEEVPIAYNYSIHEAPNQINHKT